MGTRAQVYIKDVDVYLYQHWDGDELFQIVQNAISKGDRWSYPEYLTRIIFCEMIKGYEEESTGYGIGTALHGDIEYLITVDCKNRTLTETKYFEDKKVTISFEECKRK